MSLRLSVLGLWPCSKHVKDIHMIMLVSFLIASLGGMTPKINIIICLLNLMGEGGSIGLTINAHKQLLI